MQKHKQNTTKYLIIIVQRNEKINNMKSKCLVIYLKRKMKSLYNTIHIIINILEATFSNELLNIYIFF